MNETLATILEQLSDESLSMADLGSIAARCKQLKDAKRDPTREARAEAKATLAALRMRRPKFEEAPAAKPRKGGKKGGKRSRKAIESAE